MKHSLVAGVAVATMMLLSYPGQAQESAGDQSRQKRIAEHQARIAKMLEQAQQRRTEAAGPGKTSDTGTVSESARSGDTTATANGGDVKAGGAEAGAGGIQQRERASGWRKFWEFYQTPADDFKTVWLTGSEQEYKDDVIRIRWMLGKDVSNSKKSDRTTRTVAYQWAGESGPETVLNLPEDSGSLFLRNGSHCLQLDYGAYQRLEIELSQWTQRSNFYVASRVVAPRSSANTRVEYSNIKEGYARSQGSMEFVITEKIGQVVNDWGVYMSEGTVYAQELDTTNSVKIGTVKGDGRPVGHMQMGIAYVDAVTGSVRVNVEGAFYPHTLFATDKAKSIGRVVERGGGVGTAKTDVVNELAKAYGFGVEWSDEAARSLAKKQPLTAEILVSDVYPTPVLLQIETILGPDFAPVAQGAKTLQVGLSDKYRADQEIPRLVERLQTEFKLETKLYAVKNITSFQAVIVLARDFLGCYVVTKPAAADTTSDTLKVPGDVWAIVKRPSSEADDLRRELQKTPELKNAIVCESIDNGTLTRTTDEGDILVVTATAETHARIAAWLRDIETEAKQATVTDASNEPAPQRRRLQVVLLQGGKAGASAAMVGDDGTTATYQAEIPAQFGMTPDDLKVLGFDGAVVAGRGIVDLVARPGELGESRLMLGGQYGFTVQYLQEQSGLLMVNASLAGEDEKQPLAENTMMLERGKPAFLGVTNLSGAVIVVVTWLGDGG